MNVAASAARTDVGMRRDHNEDAYIEADPLFGVADGVGGGPAGEEASQLGLMTLRDAVADIAAAGSDDEAERRMALAIEACNRAVFAAQVEDPELTGMATTITAAVVLGDSPDGSASRLVFGHVGDSRAYRIGSGGIKQLTDDHSVMGELVRSGQLSAADAAVHPQRNVITRALGIDGEVNVDAFVATFAPGEWLLLCSDGLTGHVEDLELAGIVQAGPSPQVATARLIDLANERGGSDNITVVLVLPRAGAGVVAGMRDVELSGEIDVVSIDRALDPVAPIPEPDFDPESESAPEPEITRLRAPRRRVDTGVTGRSWRTPLIALLVVAAAFMIGVFGWQQSFFLTERPDGTIGIDHGFPLGRLHTEYRTGEVASDDLTERDRTEIVDSHTLRSREDAINELDRLAEKVRACSSSPTSESKVNADCDTLASAPTSRTSTLPATPPTNSPAP